MCRKIMERTAEVLLKVKTVDFGKPVLSNEENTFYQRFSNEIVALCRSLPASVQTDAMLFVMQYSGVHLGHKMDFFAKYHSPAWSVLYWLSHDEALHAQALNHEDVGNAVTAQSMAMFLHSLDDHLVDGQVSATHLTLLLRSQAWTIMNRALCELAEGVPAGEETVQRFIDDYYAGIRNTERLKSLDKYCHLFRQQMATWLISPVLLCMKLTGISDFTRDMEIACGSFGIAWRLLDDIRDILDDMATGSHSALYVCLPENLRNHWGNNRVKAPSSVEDSTHAIVDHILEHGLIDKLKKRICEELEAAASLVLGHKMIGLAREFQCLAQPLTNSGNGNSDEGNGSSGNTRCPK